MSELTDMMGDVFAFHQSVNPQRWKINGVECEGTGGPFERKVDLVTGGLAEEITGPLEVFRANLAFVPKEEMPVVDLSDGAIYKIASVGKGAAAWKLQLKASRNPEAKPVPAKRIRR